MSAARKSINNFPNLDVNKSRKIAIALAFVGALPVPLPLAWIHKFYLGQYLWGIVYLVLAPTGLPMIACCLEGSWYASQSDEDFNDRFPTASKTLATATEVASELTQSSSSPVQTIQRILNPKSSDSTLTDDASIRLAAVLRELDQLRKEGLITEYEFEQKRRQLLDRIS